MTTKSSARKTFANTIATHIAPVSAPAATDMITVLGPNNQPMKISRADMLAILTNSVAAPAPAPATKPARSGRKTSVPAPVVSAPVAPATKSESKSGESKSAAYIARVTASGQVTKAQVMAVMKQAYLANKGQKADQYKPGYNATLAAAGLPAYY